VLKDISKMEQRYDAVLGVIRDGFTVTEVAQKFLKLTEIVLTRFPISRVSLNVSRVDITFSMPSMT